MRAPSPLRGALRAAALFAGVSAFGAGDASPVAAQVFVDWMPSPDGKQVVLNAYRLRDGGIAGDSVAALVIERKPPPGPTGRHEFVQGDRSYATEASRPFFDMLQWPVARLDSLANPGGSSNYPDRLSVAEWERLLNAVLAADSVLVPGAPDPVVFRKVPPAVENGFREWADPVFRGDAEDVVLPHLRQGWVALAVNGDTAWLDSAAVAEGRKGTLTLRNYGGREARAALSLDAGARARGFTLSTESVRLAPRAEATVTVSVPDSAGRYAATLAIDNPDGPDVQGVAAANVVGNGGGGGGSWLLRFPGILLPLFGLLTLVVLATKPGREAVRNRFKRDGKRASRPTGKGTDPRREHARFVLQGAIQQLQHAEKELEQFFRADAETALLRQQHEVVVAQLRELFPEDFAADAPPGERLTETVRGRLSELAEAYRERGALVAQNTALQGELDKVREGSDATESARKAAEQKAAEALAQVDPLEAERNQLRERLETLAQQLQLEPVWLEGLSDARVQKELASLRQGYKPAFLAQFQRLVDDLVAIYREVHDGAAPGPARDAVQAVLRGPKGNAGLQALQGKLATEDALLAALDLTSAAQLRDVTIEQFYERVMAPDFKGLLDEITRLGLYARIRERDIEQWLSEERIDPERLDRALHLVETRLRTDFGVSMHTVALFRTQFNEREHESASGGNLLHLRSGLSKTVERLQPGTIFDITSVGLAAPFINPEIRSVVAWQPAR